MNKKVIALNIAAGIALLGIGYNVGVNRYPATVTLFAGGSLVNAEVRNARVIIDVKKGARAFLQDTLIEHDKTISDLKALVDVVSGPATLSSPRVVMPQSVIGSLLGRKIACGEVDGRVFDKCSELDEYLKNKNADKTP